MTKGENGDLGWAPAWKTRGGRRGGQGGGAAPARDERKRKCMRIHREFEFNDFFTGLYTNVQK